MENIKLSELNNLNDFNNRELNVTNDADSIFPDKNVNIENSIIYIDKTDNIDVDKINFNNCEIFIKESVIRINKGFEYTLKNHNYVKCDNIKIITNDDISIWDLSNAIKKYNPTNIALEINFESNKRELNNSDILSIFEINEIILNSVIIDTIINPITDKLILKNVSGNIDTTSRDIYVDKCNIKLKVYNNANIFIISDSKNIDINCVGKFNIYFSNNVKNKNNIIIEDGEVGFYRT